MKKPIEKPAQKKKTVSKKEPREIEWMTTEFPYFHKKAGVEWRLGILALILIGIFLWFGQELLSIILLLSVVALFQLANLKPKRMKVVLNHEGLVFKGKTEPLEKFFGFWLTYPLGGALLHLEIKGILQHSLTIPLADQNPEVVRKFLKHHLPERRFKESLSERLLEKLGI